MTTNNGTKQRYRTTRRTTYLSSMLSLRTAILAHTHAHQPCVDKSVRAVRWLKSTQPFINKPNCRKNRSRSCLMPTPTCTSTTDQKSCSNVNEHNQTTLRMDESSRILRRVGAIVSTESNKKRAFGAVCLLPDFAFDSDFDSV